MSWRGCSRPIRGRAHPRRCRDRRRTERPRAARRRRRSHGRCGRRRRPALRSRGLGRRPGRQPRPSGRRSVPLRHLGIRQDDDAPVGLDPLGRGGDAGNGVGRIVDHLAIGGVHRLESLGQTGRQDILGYLASEPLECLAAALAIAADVDADPPEMQPRFVALHDGTAEVLDRVERLAFRADQQPQVLPFHPHLDGLVVDAFLVDVAVDSERFEQPDDERLDVLSLSLDADLLLIHHAPFGPRRGVLAPISRLAGPRRLAAGAPAPPARSRPLAGRPLVDRHGLPRVPGAAGRLPGCALAGRLRSLWLASAIAAFGFGARPRGADSGPNSGFTPNAAEQPRAGLGQHLELRVTLVYTQLVEGGLFGLLERASDRLDPFHRSLPLLLLAGSRLWTSAGRCGAPWRPSRRLAGCDPPTIALRRRARRRLAS